MSQLPRYGQAFLLPNGSIAPVWYDYLRTLDSSSLTAEIERQVQANTEAIRALQKAGFGEYLPASAYVLGINSVETYGELEDGARVMLRGDVALPDPTTYYGANSDQERGFHPVSDAIDAEAGELTKDVAADGVTTFGLSDVPDQGGGTLQRIQRDAKGRVSGTSEATTDDLPEGENLYFTDERVDDRVQSTDYSLAGAWSFEHNITVSGMTMGLGPGEDAANLAVGNGALSSRTTALNAVAVGSNALNSLTTGANNTALGGAALRNTSSGSTNIGIGTNAGRDNQIGNQNIAIGESSFLLATNAHGNMAIGRQAIRSFTATGNTFNVGIGNNSLDSLVTGSFNTALGNRAGALQIEGGRNCYFGRRSGETGNPSNANLTGQSNTFIGTDAGPGSPTQVSFATAIGADSAVSSSNTVVLGRTTDNTVLGATGDDGSGAKLQVTGAIKATSEYRVGADKVVGARDTGWTAVAGTAQKGGGTTYTAPTISAPPSQAEVQAMADALQDAHQKIKALQDALTAHGLIGS